MAVFQGSAQARRGVGVGCSRGARVGSEPSLLPQPMLSSSTGKPGSDAENCTIHVMASSPQPGKLIHITCPSPAPACDLGGGSLSPSPWAGRKRPAERLLLHSLGHVVMRQSYVCALIAMMVRAWEGDTGGTQTSWAEWWHLTSGASVHCQSKKLIVSWVASKDARAADRGR